MLGILHSIATVAAFIAFIAIVWWAYSPKNRKRFEDDAKLALDESEFDFSARNKDDK